MASPPISIKTFATSENELATDTPPLFFAFLKTVGNYSLFMYEVPKEIENVDHIAAEP